MAEWFEWLAFGGKFGRREFNARCTRRVLPTFFSAREGVADPKTPMYRTASCNEHFDKMLAVRYKNG